MRDERKMKNALHSSGCGLILRLSLHLLRPAVAHFQATHPEENILGDIRGVVRDSLEVAGSQDKMEVRSSERRILRHSHQQRFEDLIAILVHHVIALED